MARIHRIAGYFMLLIGNVTVMTGLGHYYSDIMQGDDRKVLGLLSLASFILLVLVFEAIFRVRNRFAKGHVTTPATSADGKVKLFTPA